MTDKLRIAPLQLNPTVGDIPGNARKILDGWAKAKRDNADLAVTTELALLGYMPEDLVKKPDLLRECAEALDYIRDATKDGPPIVVGAPVVENGIIYNAAVYINGGKIVQVIKKHDLPNYGVFDDKRLFGVGQEQEPILVKGVRIGVMVCEDTWFPQVGEHLAGKGAEILVSLNASPYEYDKEKTVRMEVLRARTKETGLPILYVNQVGGQDGVIFDGHSFALNADSSVAWKAPGWVPHQDIVACSKSGGKWKLSGAQAHWGDGLEQLYNALVLGVRDYANKNGFGKALIGLSGGADSALVAAIAVDALGADCVKCVRLPSQFTSQASMDDAEDLAKRMGIELTTLPITEAAAAVGASLTRYFGEGLGDLTDQNLQARLRGLFLMAETNQNRHELLLTTGNKSEMSVGYATLYGDMSGGFNPLKDVYKTTVFKLMKWRNAHKPALALGPEGEIIPPAIIEKKPSAELKPNQADENDLGSYENLDAVLEELIENETPVSEIVAKGHDAAYVKKISDLLDRAEYKRRQAAPGIKVTRRALFGDRRYPITNGFRASQRLQGGFATRMRALISVNNG